MLDLLKWKIGGFALAVGGAVDPTVMEQDRDSIGGDLDIAFQDVRPLIETFLKGEEGVFGSAAGRPSVTEDDRVGAVEESVLHGG